jgi:anti-sigma regulatory factor (Ser/Thr protein kinase)
MTNRDHLVSFELVFQPNIHLISIVRQFVSSFYAHILRDEDIVSNLGLATHELLENTVKYGVGEETRLSVEFDRDLGQVGIRIWNRAREEHIETLRKNVQDLSEAADAFTYYRDMMRLSAARPDGSGLGLARIAGEANMTLGVAVEDTQVCVTASTRPGAAQ